jgi:hypothetical protein
MITVEDELLREVARLRRLVRLALLGCVLVPAGLALVAWATRDDAAADVLRARALIIVDDKGRERIVLGAPVPDLKAGKRESAVNGLLILDSLGHDRIALAAPKPNPRIGGKVYKRASPSTGIQVNDHEGNERFGFGYQDRGRVTVGLDRPGKEAVILVVDDSSNYAAVIVNGANGRQRAYLGESSNRGSSGLYVSDTLDTKRIRLGFEADGVPFMQMADNQRRVAPAPAVRDSQPRR